MGVFAKFSLRNPIAIIILVILVIIGGLYSASKFKQEQMPDIAIPYLFVTSVYPGGSPQEVQNEVTVPIERVLRNIEGTQVIETNSANNISVVMLQFDFSTDIKEKTAKVEEALNGVQLPKEVEKPKVSNLAFGSSPIIYTAVTAQKGANEAQLQELVNSSIVPALQGIDGVAKVQTAGLKSENLYIKLDKAKMEQQKITFQQISQTLQAMNLSIPLGVASFDKISQPVLVTGQVKSLDELKNLLIRPMPELKLQDIATVEQGTAEPDTISRVQGNVSVALNVIKTGDANTVEVSKAVQEELKKYTSDDGEFKLDILYDTAADIEKSVDGMMREGLLGALFASILILAFLRNIRATIIAVISIPLSIFVAMTLLKYFTDITLNIMTLGGMAVAVGRVVDDSIVVIENIVRRLQSESISKELILDATKEVGKAITSSTFTTIAVFAPLGLVSGIVGLIFAPFALTVVFSLLASLLVSITVVPMLAYLMMRSSKPKEHGAGMLSNLYKRTLSWSLNHKLTVLLLAFLLFLGSLPLAGLAGFTFVPEQEQKHITIALEMPEGTDVVAVDEKVRELDKKLRDTGKVILSQVTSGAPSGEFDPMTMSVGSPNKANWIVALDPSVDVTEYSKELKDKLDPGVNGATINVSQLSGGPGGSGVYIVLTGGTKQSLHDAAEKVTAEIKKIEGTENVRNTSLKESQMVQVTVRPADALKNGLTTAQASMLIRPFLTEEKVGKVGEGAKRDDIILSFAEKQVQSISDVENLLLPTPMNTVVKVKDIADVKQVSQPSVLQTRDGQEYALVLGNIVDQNAGRVNTDILNTLDSIDLPEGVEYIVDGANKQMQDMFQDMGMAILVAIGMVYVVMVIAFGEGKAPFAILFSLPFAVIGSLIGTVVTGQPISMASMIGMLMLIGIVVTNAIVLVDRVQQQLEKGLTVREALLEAGGTRLRPILMTAIATIFALLPLALGMGEGALISKGLAVVVIGGLISSTLLTLLIVPIMYEILHRKRVKRELRGTDLGA
ncbi:efflux RND transporter permease subunit [Tumebacillus lipolyticus]|uniref:Efflux RND transporter permease subunit n=1 Tax=Tumebacillus lipolyticus TaxID=1280370 RepID=A0ABW5A0G6_9BACL